MCIGRIIGSIALDSEPRKCMQRRQRHPENVPMINVRETRVYRSIEVDGSLIPARLEVPFVVVLMRTCSTSASTATIVRTDHRRRCPPGRETAERQTKRESHRERGGDQLLLPSRLFRDQGPLGCL